MAGSPGSSKTMQKMGAGEALSERETRIQEALENRLRATGRTWNDMNPQRLRDLLTGHWFPLPLPAAFEIKRVKKFAMARQYWAEILAQSDSDDAAEPCEPCELDEDGGSQDADAAVESSSDSDGSSGGSGSSKADDQEQAEPPQGSQVEPPAASDSQLQRFLASLSDTRLQQEGWRRVDSRSNPGNFYFFHSASGRTVVEAAEEKLPFPWEVVQSRSKPGVFYYFNRHTGVSQVERPL